MNYDHNPEQTKCSAKMSLGSLCVLAWVSSYWGVGLSPGSITKPVTLTLHVPIVWGPLPILPWHSPAASYRASQPGIHGSLGVAG